jgi:hypothetical protein
MARRESGLEPVSKRKKSSLPEEIECGNEPVYDAAKPLVIELGHVAGIFPVLRRFMELARDETKPAPISSNNNPDKPVLQYVPNDEARMERRQELLETNLSYRDIANEGLDWLCYGNISKLQSIILAWSSYQNTFASWSVQDQKEFEVWTAHKLAALHTIWACTYFFEERFCFKEIRPDVWEERPLILNANMIRDKAIELWEHGEKLIGKTTCQDKKGRVVWSRLFEDLGIPLSFPRAGWRRD